MCSSDLNQIAVKVMIERKESKVFNIPVDKITVSGQNSDYELEYVGNTIPVTVRALKEDMEDFHAGDIQGAISVAELQPGIHSLEVAITLPDDRYELMGTVSVQIRLTDTRAEEDTEQEENPGDGDGTEAGGNAPGTGQDGSQPDGSGEDRDQPDSPGQDGGDNGGNGADRDDGSLRDNPTGG